MASQELWDAIDNFDYKEYLRRKGISEDKIPESLDDSKRAALFKAANDDYFANLVEQYKSDPFMKKADAEDKAREKLLEGRPWIRPLYGLWEEEKTAEELYSPDTVLAEVIRRNNITPSANGSINTQNFTPGLANREINDVIEQYAEAITSRPGLKYDAPELDGVSKSKFIEEFKYRNGLSNFETVKSFIDLYQRQRVQRLREQQEADPDYNWQTAALKEGTIGGWEMLGTAMQYWGDVAMDASDTISDWSQEHLGFRINQRVDRTKSAGPLSFVLRMRNKGIQWRDEAINDRAKHGYIPRYDGTLQDYWNEGGPWAKALWEQALTNWPSVAQNVLPFAVGAGLVPVLGRAAAMRAGLGLAGLSAIGPGGALSTGDVLQDLNDLGIYNPEEVNAMLPYVVGAVVLDFGSDVLGVLGVTGLGRSASSAVLNKVFAGRAEREAAKQALFRMAETAGGVSADTVAGAAARVSLGMQARQVLANGAGFFGKATEKYLLPGMGAFMTELWTERAQEDLAMQLANYASSPAIQGKSAWESTKDLAKAWADKGFNPRNILPWGDETMFVQDANGAIYPQRLQRHRLLSAGLLGGLMGGGTHTIVTGIQDLAGFTPERAIRDMSEKLQILDKDGNPVLGQAEKRRRGMAERLFAVLQQRNQGVTEQSVVGIDIENNGGNVIASFNGYTGTGSNAAEAYMDLSQQANEGKQQIDTKTIEEVPGVGWRAKLANGEEILVKGTNAENTLRDLVKNHNNDNHPLVISRGFTAERGLVGGHPWTITRADGFTVRAESLYDNYVFHDFAWNPANNIVMDSLVRRIPANEAEQRIALDFTQTGAINFKGQINAIRQAIANSNGRLELIKHPNAKRNALFTNTEMRVADTRFGIVYDITLNKKATNSNATVTVTGITFTGNRVQLDSNVATQTLRSAANRGALNTEIVLRAPTAGFNITPVQSPDQTSWRFDTEEVDRIAAMAGAQIRQQTPNRVDMSIPAIAEGVQIQVPFSIRVDENGVVFVEANGQSIQVDGINDRYLGANEAQRTAQNAQSILQVQALQGGEYEVVSRDQSTGEMRVRRTTNTGTTVEFILDNMGQYVEDSLEVVAAPPASLNRLQQMIDDGINRQRARTSAQRQTQQGLGQLRDPDLRTYTDAELVNLGLDPATIRESLNRSIIYHITPIVHRVNSFEELEEELVKMGFPRHRFLTRTYVDSSGLAYGKWILRDRDDVHLGEYEDTRRGFRDLIADFTRENVESVFDTQDIVPYLLEHLVENNPGRTPLEFTNDEYQKVISKYLDYYDRVFRQEAQVEGVPLSTERRQEIETRIQQQIDDLLRGQLRLVDVREVLRLYGGLIVRGWAVEDPATNSFMDRNGNLVKERDNMDAFFDDLMSIPMNLVPTNHNVVEIYRLNDTLYGYDELVEAGNDTDNINLITSTQNNRFEELVQEQINGYIEKPSQRARRGDRRYIDRLNSYLREKLQQVNAITDLGDLVRFYVGLGLNMKQYATFRVEDNGVWMFLGKDGKRYTAATVKNNKSVAAITKWYEDETISPTKFAQSFKIGQIGYTLTQEDGTLVFDYKFGITNKDGNDLTQGQILSGQSQMMDKFKEFSVVSSAFDNFKTNDFINDELIREANSEGIVDAKDEGVIRTELIAELKTRLNNSNLLSDFQDVYGSQLQVRYGFRNLTPGNNYGKYFGTNGMKDMMGVDTFLTQEQAVAINDIWANNRANTEITVYYVFYNKEGTAIYAHSREEHLDALMIQLRSAQNLERIDLDAEVQTRVEESRRAAGLANARNQELRRQRQQVAGASLVQAQSTPVPSIPATTSSADQYLHSLLGDTGLANITNLVYPFSNEYRQITQMMRDAYYATFVGSEVRDLNNSEHDLDAELMRLAGNLYKNAKKNGVVELYQTAIEFFNANQNARNSVLIEHAVEELRKTTQVTRRDVNFALELRRENRPLTAEQQGWVDEVDRIINGLSQDEREAIYKRQKVQGYWDSEAGRVILVAESIPLNHAHRVFAHELRVHATAHMTDDLAQNWVNIADFLKSQMGQNTEIGRALDRIYRFRAIQFDETRWGFWEEMAAYFVEDYEGRIPFTANIKAHFRHWFRRSGIFKGNDDITAADIVVFAKAAGSYAINHHEQMKQATEGIPAQGEFFSRLGTAFSVPENVARTEFEAVQNHYGSAERNVLMGSTFDRDTGMYQESNLNDAHWTLVRTPFYKKWFGDWEMNPNTASKIVDTNGEPLIIVHNTQHDYSAYDAPFVGNNGFFGHNGQYVYGKVGENLYNRRFSDRPRKALFLNVRNPLPLHNYELMAPIMERLGYEESAKRLDLWALADSVRSNLPLRNLLESIAGFAEDTDVDTSLADYLVLNDNNITSSFPGATFDEAHRFIVGLYEAATTPANSILTNDPVVDSESIVAYAESIEDEATLTHLDAAAKVFDRRLEGFENQMLRLAYNPDGYFTSLDAHHGDLSIVTQEPITDILSAINQRALILGEEDMLEFKSAVVAAYDEILALENVSTLQGNEAFMNLFNLALHKMRLDEVSFRLGDGLTFRTEAAYPVPTTQSLLKEHNRRFAENMKSLMIREGFDGIAGTDDILLVHSDQAKDAHGFLNPFPSVNSRRTQGVTSTRMEETVMGLLDDAITKDARTLNVEPVRLRSEYRSIYRANFVDQPWIQSNLDEYSWVMARTPSFKQHYGEWQHDPTPEMNLDYRGEPVRESGGFIAPDRIVPIQDLEQAKANNIGFYFSRISGAALQRLASHNGDIRLAESESVALEMARRGYDKADIKFATGWEEKDGRWAYDLSNYGATVISKDELTEVQKELKERGDRHASRKGAIESARRHIEDMITLRIVKREDKLINDIEKEFMVAFDNYVNQGEVSWNDFSIEELKAELSEYIKETLENDSSLFLLNFHSFFNSSYSDTLNDWLDSFEAYLFAETDYVSFIRTFNELPIRSTILEVIDNIFNYRTMDDSVAQAFHYLRDNDFILDSHIQKLENLGQTWRDESLFAPVSFIEQLKLPHVFKQEELFIAYPFLRNVDIAVEDAGTSRAWATPTMNKITLRRDYFESWPSLDGDLLEVFVHEIQHLIQYREGWSGGTSHDALLVGDYLHRLAQVDREFSVKHKDLLGRVFILAEEFIDRLAENNIFVPDLSHLENPYNILREHLKDYKTLSKFELHQQRDLTYTSMLNFKNNNERLRYLLNKVTSFGILEIHALPDSLFKGLYVGSVLGDFIHAGMAYREAKDAPYNYYWLNEGEWEARYTGKNARLTQEELNEVLLNDYMDSNSYYTAVYQGVTASRRTVHDMSPEEYLNLVLPYTNTGNKTTVNPAYFSSISSEALERMRGDRKTVNLDALKAQDKELEQLTLDKAAAESALIVAQNERQIVEDLLTKTNEEIAQLEQTQAKKKLNKKQREKYDALIREREVKMRDFDRLMRDEIAVAQQVQDAENRISQLLNDPNYIDNIKKVNEQQIQDINDRKATFIRDRANERVMLILRMGDINITLRDNPGLEQDAVNTLVSQRSAIFTQVNDVRDQAIQEVARMDDEVTRIITNDPMTQRQRELEYAVAVRNSLEQRIDVLGERIQEMTDEANLRVKGMGEKALKQIQTLQAQLVGLQTQLAEVQTREQGFEGEFTKLDQILAQKLDTLNQLAQMDGEIAAEQMEQAGKDAATILLVTGFERDRSGKWWYRRSNSKGKFRNPIEILYNTIEEIYGLAGKNVPKAYRDAYDNFVSAQEEIKKILEESLTLGKPVSTTKIKMYDAHVKPARKIHRFFFGDQTGTFTLKPTPYDDFLNKITDTAVQDEIRKRKNALHDAFVHRRGYRLEDVYEDDDLYEAYPFLRDMKVFFKYEKGAEGSFTAGTQYSSAYINVNPLMILGTFHEILLHEIQHAIQWYEGVLYTHGTTKYYHRMKELQAHMIGFIDTLPQDVIQTITTPDFVNDFYSDWTNGEGTWTSIDDTWATTGGALVPYVTTSSPMLTSNSGLTQYFSTIPNGLQKQANVQYPDFTEAQVDAYFSLSKRTRDEAIAQMRKSREGRPDLTEEQMNIILDELDKYDDRKKQLLTLKWILNGSIAMPIRGQQYEDEYKVDEAIKLADRNKVDPFKYESPVAILNEYIEFHPDSLPINPETFPEVVRDSRIDHGDGIVSYEIADTREGQEAARKIINSHLGKGWSNWCLTRANTQGELQQPDSWKMWKHYNGLPKRMAFKNGKLISFMATSPGDDIQTAFDSMLESIEYNPRLMSNYTYVTDIRNMIEIMDARGGIKRLIADSYDVWGLRGVLISKDDRIVKALRYFSEERVNELRNLHSFEDWNRYERTNFEELRKEMLDAEDKIEGRRLQLERYYRELINDPKSFRIEKSEDGSTAFIVTGDGKRVNIPYDPDYGIDYTANFIYNPEENDYFAKPQEQWWDTTDSSHPDLDWARGTVEGYTPRYSAIDPNQVIGYFSRFGRQGAARLLGTSNYELEAQAEMLEAMGKDPDTILLATGYKRDKDGHWRYEVSNIDHDFTDQFENIALGLVSAEVRLALDPKNWAVNSVIKNFVTTHEEVAREIAEKYAPIDHSLFSTPTEFKLSDIFSAPELFRAYPDLSQLPITFQSRFLDYDVLGFYDPINKRINLNPQKCIELVLENKGFYKRSKYEDKYDPRTTMLHEIQHYIQDEEGLPGGTSALYIQQEMRKSGRLDRLDKAEKDLETARRNFDEFKTNRLSEYRRLYARSLYLLFIDFIEQSNYYRFTEEGLLVDNDNATVTTKDRNLISRFSNIDEYAIRKDNLMKIVEYLIERGASFYGNTELFSHTLLNLGSELRHYVRNNTTKYLGIEEETFTEDYQELQEEVEYQEYQVENEYKRLFGPGIRSFSDLYRASMGENEANAVIARANLTQEELLRRPFELDMPISPDNQIDTDLFTPPYFSRAIPAEPGTLEYTTAYFARLTDFDENTVMRGVLSKYRNDKTRFVIPVEEQDDRTVIDIIPTLTESMDRIRTKDRNEILQQMRNALNPYIYFWRKKTEDLEFIVSPHNALTVLRDLIVSDPDEARELIENAEVIYRNNPDDYSQDEMNKLVPHVQRYLKDQRDSIVRGWIYGIMADFPGQSEYEYLIWRSLNLNLSKDKYMLPAEYDERHAKEAFKRFAQDKTYPDFYTLYIDTKMRFVESNSDEVIEITDNKGRVTKKWIKIAGTGMSLDDDVSNMLPEDFDEDYVLDEDEMREDRQDELRYEYRNNIDAVMTAAFATKWCVSYRENAEHVLIENGNDFWILYDYQKKRPLLAFVPVRDEEELHTNYQYTGIFNRSDPTDNSVPFDLRDDVRILSEQARDRHVRQTLDWLGSTWMDNQKRLERLERHISDSISYSLTNDDIQMLSEATSIPIRYDENTRRVVAEYLDENIFSEVSDILQYKILDRIHRVIGDIKMNSISSVGIEEIYGNLEVSTYAMIPNLKFIEGNINVGDNSSFDNLAYVGGDIIAGNKFSAKKLYSHHGNIQIGENAVLPYEFRFRSKIEESPYLFSGHQQFVFDQFNARTGLNLYVNDQDEVVLDSLDTTNPFFNDAKNYSLIQLLYRSIEVLGGKYSSININEGRFPRLKRILPGNNFTRLSRNASFPVLETVGRDLIIDGKVDLPNLRYVDGDLVLWGRPNESPNLSNLTLVTRDITNRIENIDLNLPSLKYVGGHITPGFIEYRGPSQETLTEDSNSQTGIIGHPDLREGMGIRETREIMRTMQEERDSGSGSTNVYFSRTGSPLGNVTNYNTDIYDRTPIPGAPGTYRLRNGQIFINPDEVADEHVARNILYALIRENKQAMENKNIAAIIDTIKGWENSADTRERNFWATIANNIHLAGLSGDKPIIAYAAREFLNQHIDARNPQGTNTIEGVFAALLNEIPEIIGQVANTSTSNVNAMPSDIITVTNALGEVQNDTVEVAVPGLQITERDLEITQRRIMAPQFMEGVMEDIKRLIDTYEDADFQFIKGQGWLRYGDMMWNIGSNLLGMRNIVDQIMHGTIDYGNYDMTDTTDEEANTPRSAFRDFVQRLPKDSPLRNQATRPDVEEFLRVFPAYIRDRIKVAYSKEPEWEELFGEDKNGIYKPYLADREIIFIKAYDRTLADVVGTISYLVSRFGWTMWNNSDFAPLMDELYTVLKHNIKEELPSFFEKLQGNSPTPSEKAALVSAFISHMGGTVYELEYFAKKSSFVPSADEQKVIDIGKRFREKIKDLELTISKTFARDFAENEEITKEYVEKLLRLTMAPVSGQGLFFAYDVDHDNLRQYDGSIPSSMQKWENLSHVTVFGNDYGPLYQAIPSSEDALTNMYMANKFRNASPYWRNVYKWWWRNRHPPMKRPGDTILGLENTVMLGRAFKAVTQEFGLALKNIYKNVTALKDELMRKGIDTDEFTEAKGYEQELRDRGITDEKLLEKAKITDTFLRYGRQRVLENVIEIRALVRYTSQRLEYWMRQENALSRDIQKMHAEMERFANRFVSDWDHRKYQAYTEDGQNDLHEMRTIVNAARVTSERWYSDIVEQNKNDLSNLEKKKQTGQIDEKTYAKERKKLRHAIKIHERLDALFHWATQDEMSQLPAQGSPGYDQRLSNVLGASRQAMINKIDEIMREVETYKERGVIGKMDLIPSARKRTLNENDPHDLLEIRFLDPVKDPALQLIFNLDQQGKITDKLIFNLRFGENLLAGGIATIKGSTETTPIRVDNLSWLENGTFLRYVQVDPFFMDEISNEVKLQDYIRQNIFGEVITTVKQNLTILNWRMAISNYIGNISNLILTGEIFRIQNLRKGMRLAKDKWWNLFLIDYNKSVEKIPEKVFAKSINEASAEYNELIKMYQHEMDKLNIWGSGISSAEITMYGQGGWEKHVDLIAAAFQTASEMANTDTFDEVTRRKWQRAAHSFMRGAREFYGFGDEWVKPLTYLNNRAVALAKYRALHNWSRYEGFENTQEAKQINEQIMDAATREAALLTFKETTTWELSPDVVRQLARTRVRVLTPDFLLHSFQMVRIYATNLYRTKEVAEEMARLRAKGKENLNPYEEAYLSLLRNEFWRRTAGQGIYTWIAAELATYGGSSLAWIFGSFAAFLSGGGGDDDEKRKKRKEERENSPFGTTFDEHVGMSMLLTGISQVGNLYMPLMWVPGKVGHEFYAYNGQRAHAALTVTPVTPPTTDPTWLERFNIILKQIVNYDSDPLSLQIANIVRQKNSFGQKITGKEQLFEMLGLLTPHFIQQGINIGRGTNELMTGTEELPWRERKKHRELAMFDVAGFKVQRVSVDDNIENLGRMIDNLASTGRNPYRREFFKKLENNLDMDESAIKSAVDDILTVNERDMERVRWILESFRKMGVEKKRLESHLAAARNTGSTIIGKQYVGQLLAGRNVLNSLLLTSLNEKISSAEKLREGTDFPPNERRKVIDNYRRAMRMIQGADL